MRILSIAGQNIASLADAFEIDFAAAPLNGAGLFAITGETGAGKSSILDAMCLALYGDAPRLAGGAAADEVPDPSGERMKAKDPRAMLRRGSVHGWAQVQFTALDGQDYTARWEARRARDKADGRMQSVSRSLSRNADGQVIAGQTSLVAEQIQKLTGLSYDEFRRTVLLAQGDFDAFLRADTNDRAGLLEKVTGTGLYRAISARVFERTGEVRTVHAALMVRQAEHHLLTEEDRAALETERGDIAAANTAAVAERKTLTAALEQHSRYAEASQSVLEAQEQAQAADLALQEAAPRAAVLAQIDRAEPLRLPWQAAHDAHQRLERTAAEAQTATEQAEQSAVRAAAQADAARTSDAAYAKTEEAFKALGRIWDLAAELDAQIKTAQTEHATAVTEAQTKAEAADALTQRLAALRHSAEDAPANLIAADAELASLSHAHALADHWGQIRRDLEDHAAACSERHMARDLASQQLRDLGAAHTALEAMTAQDTQDQTAETALTEQATELDAQITALEAAHPPAHAERLAALARCLATLTRAATDHAQAGAALAKATDAQRSAHAQASDAQATDAAATTALQQAETQIGVLLAPAEQADLALSDPARALRLRLAADTPCPVCGATDHPVTQDAALDTLAATLRHALATARQGAQDARGLQVQAQGLLAAAHARAAQARETITQAGAQQDAAASVWTEEHAAARAHPECPDLPERPEGSADALVRATAQIRAQQDAAQASAAQIHGLRKTLTEAAAQREELRTARADRSTQRARLSAQAADLRQQQALTEQQIHSRTQRIDTLATGLYPVLAAVGEPPSALEQDSTLAARLEQMCIRVTAAREARVQAAQRCDALTPQIATATSRAEDASGAAQQAQNTCARRKNAVQTLRAERAGMLDGEDTKSHRTRFNEGRKAAQDARDAAHKAAADSQQASAATAATALARQQDSGTAQIALAAAQSTLGAALAESGLDAQTLAALFATPRTEVEALRADLRRLADAVTAAGSTLRARRTDLEKATTDVLSQTQEPDLMAALAQLEAQIDARLERSGTITGDLLRDDDTRTKLAGLQTQITAAQAEMDVWQAVNDAVGSKSGDRFARIAQSITLDVLVDRANAHLEDLNPRYLLRRAADLALQVEDRDMAGEARATRSLSGGERFLVSLALALALSRMGNRGGLAATLFIDEGFGSLDAASLDLAIDALETLQSQGRQVGVISHVEAMKDRIPVRINVRKQGGGKSSVSISGGSPA